MEAYLAQCLTWTLSESPSESDAVGGGAASDGRLVRRPILTGDDPDPESDAVDNGAGAGPDERFPAGRRPPALTVTLIGGERDFGRDFDRGCCLLLLADARGGRSARFSSVDLSVRSC